MKKELLYIERQKPLWLRLIAALLFTIAFISVIYFFYTMDFSIKENHLYAHFDLLELIFVLLFFAIYLSYTINCHFDFNKMLFKRELTIGIFSFGKWKKLPNLEYVSLFSPNPSTFQINLFYNKTRHWDLYEKFDLKSAFVIAFELSEMLNLDLLDATVPYDFKWIDKDLTKTSGKIKYIE